LHSPLDYGFPVRIELLKMEMGVGIYKFHGN